ncbi:hypothetical protein BGX33_003521 [Mortierella sp. NVP41]|nr:hypothetical protein BGX33_003521 [Mortierella sp. NVP41]
MAPTGYRGKGHYQQASKAKHGHLVPSHAPEVVRHRRPEEEAKRTSRPQEAPQAEGKRERVASTVAEWLRSVEVVFPKWTVYTQQLALDAANSATPSSQAAASTSRVAAANEPHVDQLNEVMHRIEESFQSRKNSIQAMKAKLERPEDHAEPISQAITPPVEGGEKEGQSDKTSAFLNNDKAAAKEDKAAIEEDKASVKEEKDASTQEAKPTPEGAKMPTVTNGDGRSHDQLDKVMHQTEEGSQSLGDSVQAMEADMMRSGDHAESTDEGESAGHSNKTPASSNIDKGLQKERTRNAKATRAEKENGDSSPWCEKDHKIAASKEEPATTTTQAAKPTSETSKPSTAANGDGRPGRMSLSAAATYSKGNYPAKANGVSEVAKVSNIARIHTGLPLQSAGDQNLAPAEEVGTEVQAEQSAERWDSDATQVEELDVKDDAPALDQYPKVTREEELLTQMALLHSELALCEEETVSIHEELLQIQVISRSYEDRLAEMTATFEDYKRMHGYEIEKSAQTIKTLKAKLASAEERAETSASYMVDMKSQFDQERAAWRKDKEQHVKQTTELERFKSRAGYAESHLQSAELAWENEKSAMQRNLSEVEKRCTELKDQNEKLHRYLEDVSAQALSIQQSANAQVLSAESRGGASSVEGEGVGKKSTGRQVVELCDVNGYVPRKEEILGCQQDSNLQESCRSKQQLDQTDKTFEKAHALLSEDRNLQQTATVPKKLNERVTEKTSHLCFMRDSNILHAKSQKVLRQDSSLEKNGSCLQVELGPLSIRMQEVETEIEPRAEDITAKHCCIDPAKFQGLKDANNQYKIESAENTTMMTALKIEQESLQARLEELEDRFNKCNALDVSVARVSAQHSQPIKGATSGVDSAGQGGAHPMMMAASGMSGTGYPMQPYTAMMPPYYPQGYTPTYWYPGGALAPYFPMTSFPTPSHSAAHPYPHLDLHQHPRHRSGPPPRVPHSALATPAVDSLQL